MPKPGDRVVVEGTKVGGGRREGTLVGTVGSLIRVRWSDGVESVMAPGAGAVRFLPGTSKRESKGDGRSTKKPAPAKAKASKPAAKAAKKKR